MCGVSAIAKRLRIMRKVNWIWQVHGWRKISVLNKALTCEVQNLVFNWQGNGRWLKPSVFLSCLIPLWLHLEYVLLVTTSQEKYNLSYMIRELGYILYFNYKDLLVSKIENKKTNSFRKLGQRNRQFIEKVQMILNHVKILNLQNKRKLKAYRIIISHQ